MDHKILWGTYVSAYELSPPKYFTDALMEKMDQGERDYGEGSFHRDCADLYAEIMDECLDVAGWGLILDQRLHQAAAEIYQRGDAYHLRTIEDLCQALARRVGRAIKMYTRFRYDAAILASLGVK